jgi:hypothetical protein
MTNAKIFTMFLMTAFLAATLVLAGSSSPTSLLFNEPITSLNVALSSLITGVNYNIATPTINQANNVPIGFTVTGSEVAGTVLTTSGATSTITVATVADYDEIKIGESYTGNIVLTQQSPGTDTVTIPVTFIGSFCSDGEVSVGNNKDLEITDVKIDNNDGDDDEWSPRDEIEIEVEVSNNNDDDKIKDVFVEIGLFDSNGKNVIKDMEDLDDEEIDLGSIRDRDEDTAVFTFTIPADFEDDNYRLVIKAYSDDLKQENECTSESSDLSDDFFEAIDGEREEDEENHIIFDNIKITPNPAQCNEKVQLTGEIFNIGDEDYEDQVRVTAVSEGLGINTEQIVREDFDQGDSELIDFEFDIPASTEEKLYFIEFRTYYDYDDDDDTYDIVSDDAFTTTLRVAGNCNVQSTNAEITANLDSETPSAVPGKQVIINAKVRNTGDIATSYTVSVLGNSGWSSLSSIEPRTLNLLPGESRDVSIALAVNADATGDNELTIRATYGEKVTDQRVVLTVSEEGASTGSADMGPFVGHLKDNWFIYLIILVNIVLIVAIILVIRSMVSPRPL